MKCRWLGKWVGKEDEREVEVVAETKTTVQEIQDWEL
jgi:hypothetical protein